MLVGLHVFRSASFGRSHLRLNRRFGGRIGAVVCELTAHLSHDGLGEFGLDGEPVFQIQSKIFRPELLARVGASQSGAMRTMSPALRTLPSTRCATPSFCPISCAVAFLPLNENAEVRAATCRPGIFCSTVSNSSLMPSEKYSLPLSSLRLPNASTATDLPSAADLGSAHGQTATTAASRRAASTHFPHTKSPRPTLN